MLTPVLWGDKADLLYGLVSRLTAYKFITV